MGQYRNETFAPVEGAKLFRRSQMHKSPAQQRKHDLARVDFVLDLGAPNGTAVNSLGVEPGIEAFFRKIELQALGQCGSVLAGIEDKQTL
jgi:hypothetical protein